MKKCCKCGWDLTENKRLDIIEYWCPNCNNYWYRKLDDKGEKKV